MFNILRVNNINNIKFTMNKNINFFDNLDGGWGDLIANVYEDSIDKYNITITYKNL